MKISVSQLKTYNASPAKWAGLYILWIKEDISNDAFVLGQLAEQRLITGQDDWSILEWKDIIDKEKFNDAYEAIKHNSQWLVIPKWVYQYKMEWIIDKFSFIGYADIIDEECVYDIKTSQYLTKLDSNSLNMWSNLSSYDEYALQLWIYMKLTGKKKAQILEVSKHKYEDNKPYNQIIEFTWSEEWDKKMSDKWIPVMYAMQDLYTKYKQ